MEDWSAAARIPIVNSVSVDTHRHQQAWYMI